MCVDTHIHTSYSILVFTQERRKSISSHKDLHKSLTTALFITSQTEKNPNVHQIMNINHTDIQPCNKIPPFL